MVDVIDMPNNSFGYVPTPAIVAPLEFTLESDQYKKIGGHMEEIRSKDDVIQKGGEYGDKKLYIP